jgi:hypothetical protein
VTRPYLIVVLVALLAIGGLLAAMLGGPPPTAPIGSPGASGVSGSPIAVHPADCPLDQDGPAPSPGAAPTPSPAAFDDAGSIRLVDSFNSDPDQGTGRLRLCVDGVDAIEVAIGCTWSVDRSAVERIGGAVERPGGGQAYVGVDLTGGRFVELDVELGLTTDPVGQYRSIGLTRIGIDTDVGLAAGVIRFDDMPFDLNAARGVEPPSDQPAAIGGSTRWSCDPAPPPLPGTGTGHMTIRLDLPVGQEVEADAVCHWSAGITGPSVASVEMAGPPIEVGGGRSWSLQIAQLGDPPLAADPEVQIYLSTPDGGDSYAPETYAAVIPVGIGAASRDGSLRFQGLVLGEETRLPTLDGTERTRTLSGVVSWSCGAPLRPPDPLPGGVPPIVRPQTRPGLATLTLEGIIDVPIGIVVTCRVHDNPGDAEGLWVDGADGLFTVGDESVRLIVNDGSLVLFRVGPDGRILGEYVGDGTGPYLGAVDEVPPLQRLGLLFRPLDPVYSPFGGDAGPREIEATLMLDCRDPNAAVERPRS